MADNRSRIESVRRELRAIASFDAQKIHESSGAAAFYNQPSARPGAPLLFAPLLFAALFAFCLQAGAMHSRSLSAVLEEPPFTSPSKSSELASKSRCCCARPGPAQSSSRRNPLCPEFFWMRSRLFSAERTHS